MTTQQIDRKSLRFNVSLQDGQPTGVTVYYNGRIYVATSGHPNFWSILSTVRSGWSDPSEVVEQFDTAGSIQKRLSQAADFLRRSTGSEPLADVADRIKISRTGRVTFDGKPVPEALADAVVAYYRQGRDNIVPLLKFIRNIQNNPNAHSRESLYTWMQHLSFDLDDEGHILAYKGVEKRVNDEEDGAWLRSRFSGSGRVNGVNYSNAHLPNNPGDVVEMDRHAVTHDPEVACAPGLHVGTVDYARNWGPVVIQVRIDPQDVVSVPTDCDGKKMRVAKYTVVQETEDNTPTLSDEIPFDDPDFGDWDAWDDEDVDDYWGYEPDEDEDEYEDMRNQYPDGKED